ncbi:hypothetical protein [Legionella worsleiensis]|uniref:Substrate of the Dot/Icm secretion system n=1 Tax=Legionella worsleiensis TaxID=45076 RepID=A0A0W1A4B3_9GAMM|nr:hypothetical protein [Legionella worsleiensis]KTD76175.1 hypothetical protein Lwor_2293 [Legionella worsleiensis]STY33249.1 Dot/Icm secretion system substrate [Legionella worsleiensis]
MSRNDEQQEKNVQKERQRLAEQQRKKNELDLLRQAEEQRLKDEQIRNAILDDSMTAAPVATTLSFQVQPPAGEGEDWQKIIEDFKKLYPYSPIKNNILTFPTQKDAINFFTAQARQEPPRKFLAIQIGSDGKPTGYTLFSCGNGTLYQGSLAEIESQLKAELKNQPDDHNLQEGLATIMRASNTAQSYKESLKLIKEPSEGKLEHDLLSGQVSSSSQHTK